MTRRGSNLSRPGTISLKLFGVYCYLIGFAKRFWFVFAILLMTTIGGMLKYEGSFLWALVVALIVYYGFIVIISVAVFNIIIWQNSDYLSRFRSARTKDEMRKFIHDIRNIVQ